MKVVFGAATLAAMALAGSVWAAAAPSPQDIVDDRVAGMKSLFGLLKGAEDATNAAVAKENLAKAIALAKAIPSKFPKGTGIGDAGVKKTRALQDIWTKPADFKAASDGFASALEAASAAAGDAAKFGAAMGGAKKYCGSCHEVFRGPATEK
jgi:cytochrome c556